MKVLTTDRLTIAGAADDGFAEIATTAAALTIGISERR